MRTRFPQRELSCAEYTHGPLRSASVVTTRLIGNAARFAPVGQYTALQAHQISFLAFGRAFSRSLGLLSPSSQHLFICVFGRSLSESPPGVVSTQ